MVTRAEQRPGTLVGPGGGIPHVLRAARARCRSASAVCFAALSVGDQHLAAADPDPAGESALGADAMRELVRRLWVDPGIARGRAQLRTVRLEARRPGEPPRRLAVAAVPVRARGASRPSGFLGLADPGVTSFGIAELALLNHAAQHLAPYVALPQPPPGPFPEGSAGALLDRTRSLLGAAAAGTLAVVALEVCGAPSLADVTAAAVTRAMRADLRFDDPVARIDGTSFLAVVPLTPGGTPAAALTDRLATTARAAAGTDAAVRSVHVEASLGARADAGALVRAAIDKLRAGGGTPR